MTRYIGILDGKPGGFGLYFPDVGGCVAMGNDIDDVTSNAIASVRLWAQDTVASGEPLPILRDMDALRADPQVAAELSEGSTFVVVPLLLDRGRATRANISIDAGLLEAIDAAARDRGLTRSAFLASAAREKIAGGA